MPFYLFMLRAQSSKTKSVAAKAAPRQEETSTNHNAMSAKSSKGDHNLDEHKRRSVQQSQRRPSYHPDDSQRVNFAKVTALLKLAKMDLLT